MAACKKLEERFEYELEVFRKEADEAVQQLFVYLTMHAVAGDHKSVRQLYNSAPLFWLTTLRSLQTSRVIVLRRIFSQDSEPNLDRLVRIAEEDQEICSHKSPARRKSEIAGFDGSEYGRDAFEPTADDFRGLRREVR